MGRPKLLMPWRGGILFQQVLQAWVQSTVDRTVVVVRADDAPLRAMVETADVDVVPAAPAPADMKASVRLALTYLRGRYQPTDRDSWLLAPADLPELTTAAIDHVVAVRRATAAPIVVPRCAGRRGHPVAFAWPLADEVDGLRAWEGVNALLARHPVHDADWNDPSILTDVDTPEDYRRLQ